MKLGITYDYEQCTNLGLDYKEVLDMIHEMNIKIVRVGLKWNRIAKQKGEYNWGIYDEILNYLDKENIEVILCLGMKSPRWPEFFIPEWLNFKKFKGFTIERNNDILRQKLFQFIEEVLERYSSLKCMKCLQLENEPFLKAGPQKGMIDHLFLVEEMSFLKTITKLPIILNAQGLPTTGVLAEYLKGRNKYKRELIEISDIFGVNVYEKFESEAILGIEKTFRADILAWKYLKGLINYAKKNDKDVLVTELQAEPWQTGEVSLEDAYANKTCNPKIVLKNIQRVKNLGIETILLWGFEFHIACKKKGNDEWIDFLYRN